MNGTPSLALALAPRKAPTFPMAATTPIDLPAARLRAGDLVPAYGPQAVVTRPPVVSVDGAMTNVLVADSAQDEAPTRLVRMPVGLRVSVHRPASDGKFVRATKTARSSGARIAILDLCHPDAEVAPASAERFATLCTVHHIIKAQPGVSTAEAQASHPEQWCAGCAEAATTLAHSRVYGDSTNRQATA